MIIYLFWLLMVILWNYGFPDATPLEDVIMAIVIGFVAYKLKKFIPDPAILTRNKYFGNKK